MRNMANRMRRRKQNKRREGGRHDKIVPLIPKPLFQDNGSGMHSHQSIWKEGRPLFAGTEYAGVSQLCLWYIGGILKHAPAFAAFNHPNTNFYKQLTPGFEAPVNLAYFNPKRGGRGRISMYTTHSQAQTVV